MTETVSNPDLRRKDANEKAQRNVQFEEVEQIKDIPPAVIEELVEYSKRERTPDVEVQFSKFLIAKHGERDVTYIAFEKRNDEFGPRELAYLIDYLEGKVIGKGEIINDPSRGEHSYVGHTVTREHLMEGFGERRIVMMGVLSTQYWNLPLQSSDQIRAAARKVWEKLVRNGRAEKIDEDQGGFRFLS